MVILIIFYTIGSLWYASYHLDGITRYNTVQNIILLPTLIILYIMGFIVAPVVNFVRKYKK